MTFDLKGYLGSLPIPRWGVKVLRSHIPVILMIELYKYESDSKVTLLSIKRLGVM